MSKPGKLLPAGPPFARSASLGPRLEFPDLVFNVSYGSSGDVFEVRASCWPDTKHSFLSGRHPVPDSVRFNTLSSVLDAMGQVGPDFCPPAISTDSSVRTVPFFTGQRVDFSGQSRYNLVLAGQTQFDRTESGFVWTDTSLLWTPFFYGQFCPDLFRFTGQNGGVFSGQSGSRWVLTGHSPDSSGRNWILSG